MNLSEIRKYVTAEFPEWLVKYERAPASMVRSDLLEWLDGDDSHDNSIGEYLSQLSLLELKAFVLSTIEGHPRPTG